MARPNKTVIPGSVTAEACVFCGDEVDLNDEHLFGNWVSRLFGAIPSGGAEVWDSEGSVVTWTPDLFQDVLHIVCRSCNNHWMSDLETDVSRWLGPMMKDGVGTSLSPRRQKHLAAWAVKTALVADYIHGETQVVPEPQYSEFRATKLPLPGQMVWMANRATFVDATGRDLLATVIKQPMNRLTLRDGDDPDEVRALIEGWTSDGRAGYWFTVACGHFICVVYGHTFPMTITIDVETGGVGRFVQRIWPVSDDLYWPLPDAVEAMGGVNALHRAFHGDPGATSA